MNFYDAYKLFLDGAEIRRKSWPSHLPPLSLVSGDRDKVRLSSLDLVAGDWESVAAAPLLCLFCGSQPIIKTAKKIAGDRYFVACPYCESSGPVHDTRSQAVYMWNEPVRR